MRYDNSKFINFQLYENGETPLKLISRPKLNFDIEEHLFSELMVKELSLELKPFIINSFRTKNDFYFRSRILRKNRKYVRKYYLFLKICYDL